MQVVKVNDIDFREADYYTNDDVALVLRKWELEELKTVLEEWVESHSVVQGPTASGIVRNIREFEKQEEQ